MMNLTLYYHIAVRRQRQ